MDPISIAMGLAQFAPAIVGWIAGDKAEEGAQKAVNIARSITGQADPESALKELGSNQEFAMKFQVAVMSHELAMAQEETKRIQAVNETMRAESVSEHWPQWSWRPFNGYMFGITIFMNYAFPQIVNMFIRAAGDPLKDGTYALLVPGTIPEFVFMAWAAVLGVSAWHRGKEKLVKHGVELKELIQRRLS
jgi:hypothetical protein